MGSKKLGMWLFIVSDTLTFSVLLITYSYSRLTNPDWPRPFPINPAIIFSTTMTVEKMMAGLIGNGRGQSGLVSHHLLHDNDGRAAREFVDDGDGRDGGAAQRPSLSWRR